MHQCADGFFMWAAIFGQARPWISTDPNEPRYIRKPLNLLDDWWQKGFDPYPIIQNDGF
jgi:hypothetical protein